MTRISSSIQLPINQTFKKIQNESDDSPNESVDTRDGSEYGQNFRPLNLSLSEKERVYILVDWKLKKLLSS